MLLLYWIWLIVLHIKSTFFLIMTSSKVSSLLNRFKFEQKPKKQIHLNAFSEREVGHGSGNAAALLSDRESGQEASGSSWGLEHKKNSQSQRSSTPELSDGVLCVPDTPTSELPESIDSGSPVFRSSTAKKRASESSQRSAVSSTISSLLSPTPQGGGDRSPTFGKSSHLTNGYAHLPSQHRRNRQRISFTDSESDGGDTGMSQNSLVDSPLSPKFHRKDSMPGGSESDSTHITNMGTQDSLETVNYSYENSESSQMIGRIGAKRKLSELSNSSESENVKTKDLPHKAKRDAVDQLRICFPNKTPRELVAALAQSDWNINHAANELMKARDGVSPQKKPMNIEENKTSVQAHQKSPPAQMNKKKPAQTQQKSPPVQIKPAKPMNDYQSAFSGWLQKPTADIMPKSSEVFRRREPYRPIEPSKTVATPTPKPTMPTPSTPTPKPTAAATPSTSHYQAPHASPHQSPPLKQRKVDLSSDESDSVPERHDNTDQGNNEPHAKKTFRRIRTFSSDSMEEMSPMKNKPGDIPKSNIGSFLQSNIGNSPDQTKEGNFPKGNDDQGNNLNDGEGDDGIPSPLVDHVGNDGDDEESRDGIKANSNYKKGSVQNGFSARKPPRAVWNGFTSKEEQNKKVESEKKKLGKAAKKKAKRRRYSDSEDDIDIGLSDSDYEEEVEIGPEFKEMALAFFNDATVEELVCIEGCSKGKAEKVMSLRPFKSFTDLKERIVTKGLGSHLIWNCESVFIERQIMEDLMERCANISARIQKMVTAVIDNPDSVAVEGQITRQPALLNDSMQLKPYQLIGLNWLKLMHTQKVNGILADEMGLGKTIQVIAFLSQLMEDGNKGPHLVVAPSSTIENWMREFRKWCPAIEVLLYHGSLNDRAELREEILYNSTPCNVIVTSYNLCTSSPEDKALFRKLPLQYAIFDEGHMLKNMKSQRFGNLMKIPAERRLLLTGTPLQNNLQELISVLTFTLPNLFGTKASKLTRIFSMAKQKSGNPHEQSSYEMERIAHAKQIMQPFLLRRIKKDVLKQLPEKKEVIEHIEMTDNQSSEYVDLKKSFARDYRKGGMKSAGKVNCAMMELRKQANHPLLIRRRYTDAKLRVMAKLMLNEPTHCDANKQYIFEDMQVMSDFELFKLCHEYASLADHRLDKDLVAQSGKLNYLDDKLIELLGMGDRVLLFSQFVMVLDIVEEFLKMRGFKYLRMDGQTPILERLELMDKFNNDDSYFIFMLSTRAGGVGINLTGANTVILHDIDFNPYNDKQAEDRCHRVGQTRDVTVIRLVSKNTIEEAMLSCAKYKLKLEQQMTSGNAGEDGEEDKKNIETLLRNALDI